MELIRGKRSEYAHCTLQNEGRYRVKKKQLRPAAEKKNTTYTGLIFTGTLMARAPSDPNTLITTRSRSDEISTYAAASHDDQVLDQMFSSAANELNVPSDQMNEILRLNTICRQFRQWPEGIALIFLLACKRRAAYASQVVTASTLQSQCQGVCRPKPSVVFRCRFMSRPGSTRLSLTSTSGSLHAR
jgi:hypothetical protein